MKWLLLGLLLLPLAHGPGLWWDEAVYLGLAKNMPEGYWINSPGQESFRPPLFPLILAAVTSLTPLLAILISPIFAAAAVIVSYLLGKELFSHEVGLWTALLTGTSHLFLFFSSKILTESLFIFLSILGLYTFLRATKTRRPLMFIATGILFSLAFLTRYAGILLFSVYILYPLYSRKLYRQRAYWVSFLAFLLILMPWFFLGIQNYDSPLGALFSATREVDGRYYPGGAEFYFTHWLNIFGILGVFAIPGALALRKLEKEHVFLLLLLATSLIFFAILPRKEERYLLHFLPVYTMLFSLGIIWIKNKLGRKNLVTGIALVFVGMNIVTGIILLTGDIDNGKALQEASLFLSPYQGKVMTNNMPVVSYLSGREVVFFPSTEEEFLSSLDGVTHILIHATEPSYPSYVRPGGRPSTLLERFTLEQTFLEHGKPWVWVYRV